MTTLLFAHSVMTRLLHPANEAEPVTPARADCAVRWSSSIMHRHVRNCNILDAVLFACLQCDITALQDCCMVPDFCGIATCGVKHMCECFIHIRNRPFFFGQLFFFDRNCQQLTLCASCSTPRATGSRVRANLVKGDTRMSDVAASCRGPACKFIVTSSRVLLPYIAYPATPAHTH